MGGKSVHGPGQIDSVLGSRTDVEWMHGQRERTRIERHARWGIQSLVAWRGKLASCGRVDNEVGAGVKLDF